MNGLHHGSGCASRACVYMRSDDLMRVLGDVVRIVRIAYMGMCCVENPLFIGSCYPCCWMGTL